jgi:putative transposase
MPDHVHFFCRPEQDAKTLSRFIGAWKTWTSRRIQKNRPQPTAAATAGRSLWQREFFDHLLRSSESYGEKWNYVRENPVRAGLVASADDWPNAGEIERLQF